MTAQTVAPGTSLRWLSASLHIDYKVLQRQCFRDGSILRLRYPFGPHIMPIVCLQAREDTYLQLEFWDENIDLIEKSAAIIKKAGWEHKVIVGSPQSAKIWRMCGQELPNASRILPNSEVIPGQTPLSRGVFCGCLSQLDHVLPTRPSCCPVTPACQQDSKTANEGWGRRMLLAGLVHLPIVKAVV